MCASGGSTKLPLSRALSNEDIRAFAAKNSITTGFLSRVNGELNRLLEQGTKVNFGATPDMPVKPDPNPPNIFILGRKNNKAIISLIDQGQAFVPGVAEMLRRGLVFR